MPETKTERRVVAGDGEEVVDERARRLRLPYVVKKLELTKAFVENLREMTNRRAIRERAVKKYCATLETGHPFAGPFVLHQVEDARTTLGYYFVTLDGHHRRLGLIRFFERHPNFVVEAFAHIYQDLTREQEITVYNEYCDTIHQTETDKVGINEDEIPICGMMKRAFPAPIRIGAAGAGGNHGAFNLIVFLKALMARYNISGWRGENLVDDLKRLVEADYRAAKEIAEIIVEVFGWPTSENHYTKATPLTAIIKVVACNLSRYTRREVVRRLKVKVYQNPRVSNDILLKTQSFGNLKELTETIVKAANKGYSTKLFITPEQLAESLRGRAGRGE